MKSFDEFVTSSKEAYGDSIKQISDSVEVEAVKPGATAHGIMAVAIGASIKHTNRMLRLYHEWLTAQLEEQQP